MFCIPRRQNKHRIWKIIKKKKNQSSDPHHCCCWRDPQKGASKGLREAFYFEYRSLEPSFTSLDGILVEPPALAMSNSPKYHQEKKYFWSVKAISSLNFYIKVDYHLNRTIIGLPSGKLEQGIYRVLGLNWVILRCVLQYGELVGIEENM